MNKLKNIEKLVDAEIDRQIIELEKNGRIAKAVQDAFEHELDFLNDNDFVQDQATEVVEEIVSSYVPANFKMPKNVGNNLINMFAETISDIINDNVFVEDFNYDQVKKLTSKVIASIKKQLIKPGSNK